MAFNFEEVLKKLKGNVWSYISFQVKEPMDDYFYESINEGKYHDWRNDESLTPKQKIGKSIREVRNSLNELDKTIKMSLRLKNELNVDSRSYWKNTHKALSSISERLVKLASRVGNLK
jgi:archaellum component FlaC